MDNFDHCIITSELNQVINSQPSSDKADEFLQCEETLDRSSPTLWPQPIPGFIEFLKKIEPEWKADENDWDLAKLDTIEDDDYELICLFRDAKPNQLMDQVTELNNYAYQLSIEESREINRGMILNIFDTSETNYSMQTAQSTTAININL